MANYIGVRCPVCNKKFTEADDIVVCPVCGAPHHRDCYAGKNQCFFAADHLSGKEWADPNAQVPPPHQHAETETKECPRCGAKSPRDAIFCQVCGQPMALHQQQGSSQSQQEWIFPDCFGIHVDAISMAYGGLNPDDEIDGESVKDLAAYIGNGSAYYLPRFRMMSESDRAMLPSLPAFFFSFFFYFYRKMYLLGAILLALRIVGSIPAYLYIWEALLPTFLQTWGLLTDFTVNQATADHYAWLSNVASMINMAISLIFSLYANRAYHSKVIQDVHALRSQKKETLPPEEYTAALAKAGGISKPSVIIIAASYLALSIAIVSMMQYFILL